MRRRGIAKMLLLLLLSSGGANAERATEEQVKAAYLYHFVQFIDWNATVSGAPTDPLQLCLIGGNPFGSALSDLLSHSMSGRPLQLQMLDDLSRIDSCHVLYFNKQQRDAFTAYLQYPKRPPALTVSDMEGFAPRGGMIGLLTLDGRVRIEINRRSVEETKLQLSAKVFEVAFRVYADNGETR